MVLVSLIVIRIMIISWSGLRVFHNREFPKCILGQPIFPKEYQPTHLNLSKCIYGRAQLEHVVMAEAEIEIQCEVA